MAIGKPLQDYMMHYILRLANKRGLTFQFHTGLQEGNGNIIYNSDPSLLSNLFLEYPDVDFDIFHIDIHISIFYQPWPRISLMYILICVGLILFHLLQV